MLKKTALLLGLLLRLTDLHAAAANDQTAVQEKLGKTQSRLFELKQNLFSNEQRETQCQAQLTALDKEIKQKNLVLEKLQHEILQKEETLKKLEETQEILNQKLAKQHNVLARQLKMLYALKQNNELKLLLNLESPEAFSRVFEYYPFLKTAYVRAIQQSSEDLATLAKNKTEVMEEKTALSGLMAKRGQQLLEVKKLRQQQVMLLKEVQGKVSADQKQLKLIQAEEKHLIHRLKVLELTSIRGKVLLSSDPSFIRSKGDLYFPILGPSAKAIKASLPSTAAGNPVMIPAEVGAEIHAVSSGRVVFAEPLKGFGLLVIIDHGAGYMSLYGNNQALYKKVGDTVRKGELIGRVARTSELGNSSLYFEIRKNGKPINLVGWFK